ncbi:kunitz-type serine protease inhibitor LmKTT-1b [Lucilia cuprina]|uniref:kunitz-type serine protease inhibitor LmKTT-1b n=1 Tax=Lucilia cuprina TaxID=7375 RepID=UPI001F061FD8|nr:kunitz-type serine protease inhibitor LmKTT-1b [Lucilia cuprina]
MAKLMNSFLIICLIFNFILLLLVPTIECSSSTASSKSAVQCKELNQWNCYSSRNEGYFCNSKDQSTTETRWFYDKGHCRKFAYKGCNGNRNRFCTKETCMKRCQGE